MKPRSKKAPVYRSQPVARPVVPIKGPEKKKRKVAIPLIALVLLVAIAGVSVYLGSRTSKADANTKTATKVAKANSEAPAAPPKPVNYCANNTLSQLILVSVSKQHTWACAGATQVNDFAVITGMEQYPADLTPVGTYHIYAKTVNQTLAGRDNTGSWSDFVNYWIPFLDNQYGTYGFHDLTQAANGANGRADSDFGNVDINAPATATKHASHGCVETPLAAMKWLYEWSKVGTTVSVVS